MVPGLPPLKEGKISEIRSRLSSAPTVANTVNIRKRRTLSATPPTWNAPTGRIRLNPLPPRGQAGQASTSTSAIHSRQACVHPKAANVNARLERVIGCTAVSQAALAVDERTGNVAHLAGASVVIWNSRQKKQAHLVGTTKNTLSCVAFSPCGRFLATGEFGHAPCVRLWEVADKDGKFICQQSREFSGHTFGIVAVKFVPNSTRLISVGEQHDQMIALWDWKSGEQVATSKASSLIHGLTMSASGESCVTVGLRHVKFWQLGNILGRGLQGRSAILTGRRQSTFIDAVFISERRVFAATENGLLVDLVDKKLMSTYDLGASRVFALSLLGSELLIGCANGVVRSLKVETRVDASTTRSALSRPHFIGMDAASATDVDSLVHHPETVQYPDVHAMGVHQASSTVTVVYADHSIYSWQIAAEGCRKLYSSLAHVGPINALEVYPNVPSPFLPANCFLTGGSDGSLRIWNFDSSSGETVAPFPARNLLSNEMKKMIYLDENASLVVNKNTGSGGAAFDRLEQGIKCLRVSRDGRHVAAGLRNGSIFVIDLADMSVVIHIEAHDGDIFCIEYSDSNTVPYLMATGGRDRLVHLVQPQLGYKHLCTVDDHQSGVVAIKFIHNADLFMMFTCASDKVIVIRRLIPGEKLEFERINQITAPCSMHDVQISSDVSLLAVCQDRQIRQFNLAGKQINAVRATSETGTSSAYTMKMCLDPSGTFAASICSDRIVYVVEVKSGNPVAVLTGFGELPTAIAFSADFRRLLVSSSNGCVYMWRLSDRLVTRIAAAKRILLDESARAASPDSVLGSSSEAASDSPPAKGSDAGSHFGSSVSLQVGEGGEEETESGLGSAHSGILIKNTPDSALELPLASATREEVPPLETSPSPSTRRPYQPSKSMNNIHSGATLFIEERDASPRRPRKKWTTPEYEFPRHQAERVAHPTSFVPSPDARTIPPTIASSSSNYEMSVCGFSSPAGSSPSQAGLPLRDALLAARQRELTVTASPPAPLAHSSTVCSPITPVRFTREALDRMSISKKFQLDVAVNEGEQLSSSAARTAWTPPALSIAGSSSRLRSTSNMGGATPAPSGAAASAITRRQSDLFRSRYLAVPTRHPSLSPTRRKNSGRTANDEEVFSTLRQNIRSRSQSPIGMGMNGGQIPFSSAASPAIPSGHSRRDSELSGSGFSSRRTPSRSNLRAGDENSKSREALDRIMQTRRLRKSTENIAALDGELEDSPCSSSSHVGAVPRSRSIGNLRAAQLEAVELEGDRPRLPSNSSSSSLSRSRLLARSVGALSAGSPSDSTSTGSRLLNAMNELKKASNPDLAQAALYGDADVFSPIKTRRGAVQKKVERFHPRRRHVGDGRVETSNESDSNGSDGVPLGDSVRGLHAPANHRFHNGRSVSSVEGSRLFTSSVQARRLFDQQRLSPRRLPNYLAQKMAAEDVVGPDLGSDESPRSSVVPANAEWLMDFQGKSDEARKLALHVRGCVDDLLTVTDKLRQAGKLIRESRLPEAEKASLLSVLRSSHESALRRSHVSDEIPPSSIEVARLSTAAPSDSPRQRHTAVYHGKLPATLRPQDVSSPSRDSPSSPGHSLDPASMEQMANMFMQFMQANKMAKNN